MLTTLYRRLLLYLLVLGMGLTWVGVPALAHGAAFGPRPPDQAPDIPRPPEPRVPKPPPPPLPPRPDAPPERPVPRPPVPDFRPGGSRPPPTTPGQNPVPVAPKKPGTPPPTTTPGGVPSPGGAQGTGPTTSSRLKDRKRGRTAAAASIENSWETWWALNRASLLPDRRAGAAHRTVTPREADDPEAVWTRQRGEVARQIVLPFLLRLVDPKQTVRNDVRASALIALGKVDQSGLASEILFRWLEEPRAATIIRESAALGIGLLRRSRPSDQATGARLDVVRARLLDVFDDARVPARTRAFAALAVGLLGDQPFGDTWTKDGRLIIRDLWQRLRMPRIGRDLRVALLVALGRQPTVGAPDGVRTVLRHITMGKRALKQRWSAIERSHALTAFVRLGGRDVPAFLKRTLENKRTPRELRRAAFVALTEKSMDWSGEDRAYLATPVAHGIALARDPLTEGLGHVAAGRLLGADLAAGSASLLDDGRLAKLLLKEAQGGATPTRGFSVLALALAARDITVKSRDATAFETDAASLMHEGLAKGRGGDAILGAYAVGLGLLRAAPSRSLLTEILADEGRQPSLRGHAAVALGQIENGGNESRRALGLALSDSRFEVLRREAALGLSLLGGRVVGTQLLRELARGKTERTMGQVVIALGQLGDLGAVDALVEHASDAHRSELGQALGVVALGRLADPEARPSLLRLTRNANYPSRTEALHEVYTIL